MYVQGLKEPNGKNNKIYILNLYGFEDIKSCKLAHCVQTDI